MTAKSLPLGKLNSATELFQKLKRDACRLHDEVTSDRFFDFVVTGYSLIDWVKKDTEISIDAQILYDDHWLKICGDLATAAKHFELDRREPRTSAVVSEQAYGKGRYGKGAYGVGEEAIEVRMNDDTTCTLDELVEGVLDAWRCLVPSVAD